MSFRGNLRKERASTCELPMCRTAPGRFQVSSEVQTTRTHHSLFLHRYYLIHDYGDRQYLLGAYHDEACFSLTIPFNPQDPAS